MAGQIVRGRTRHSLVEDVAPSPTGTRLRLTCVDDDAQGDSLEVLWEAELDGQILAAAALAGVHRLRELHAAMDAAVLTVYGWSDLLPKCACDFLLDYEDDESESGAEESGGRKQKKPWRYRWPNEVRDEVLARLIKLNAERAEEEKLAGAAAELAKPTKAKMTRGRKSCAVDQGELIDPPQKDLFD